MIETNEMLNTDVAVVEIPETPLSSEEVITAPPAVSRTARSDKEFGPLFEGNIAEQLRAHWLEVQGCFVDDPTVSLSEADELVIHVTEYIISSFLEERLTLESQWQGDDQVSTEEKRLALKRYRAFFNRLLSLEY
jgi:hypothetical protein